ncbi:hypothetical protein QTP88_025805 [Uroleucon formosanum]
MVTFAAAVFSFSIKTQILRFDPPTSVLNLWFHPTTVMFVRCITLNKKPSVANFIKKKVNPLLHFLTCIQIP